MTKKSETRRFNACRFAKVLLGYLQIESFDVLICNNGKLTPKFERKYKKAGSFPVKLNKDKLGKYAKTIITENLIDEIGDVVRHNEKMAQIIAGL